QAGVFPAATGLPPGIFTIESTMFSIQHIGDNSTSRRQRALAICSGTGKRIHCRMSPGHDI
ncbi:MAG: hypothetical protein ACN6N0_13480, partial [Microvirgula sp.]